MSSSPSQKLFQYLLTILEKSLTYQHNTISFLPQLSYVFKIHFDISDFPFNQVIADKSAVVSKYKSKIPQFLEFNELYQIYQKLYDLCINDLTAVDNVLANFSTLDKIGHPIINYVYPPGVSKILREYIASGDSWIMAFRANDPNDEFLEQTLTKIELAIEEFPDWNVLQSNLKHHISSYEKLFPGWNSLIIENPLFVASIIKEIEVTSDDDLEFESNYKNSILQAIVDNEAKQSPQSFNDQECQILDTLEILTFHIDSMRHIIYLINSFGIVLSAKLHFADELNMRKFEYNFIRLDTTPDDPNLVLNKFYAELIEPTIQTLINGGTKGLSVMEAYYDVVSNLKQFHSYLNIIKLPQFPENLDSRSLLYYRDEIYFCEVLHNYQQMFHKLLCFLSQQRNDITLIIVHKKTQFEEVDTDVKDLFFDLCYFRRKFNWELYPTDSYCV